MNLPIRNSYFINWYPICALSYHLFFILNSRKTSPKHPPFFFDTTLLQLKRLMKNRNLRVISNFFAFPLIIVVMFRFSFLFTSTSSNRRSIFLYFNSRCRIPDSEYRQFANALQYASLSTSSLIHYLYLYNLLHIVSTPSPTHCIGCWCDHYNYLRCCHISSTISFSAPFSIHSTTLPARSQLQLQWSSWPGG